MPAHVPHILIIEDQSTLCAVLRIQLESLGYVATLCNDGAGGLALAQLERPDVVLLDLGLPTISGEEICRILKGSSDTRHIPVVLLSGRPIAELEALRAELGADACLTKPYGGRKLADLIRSLCPTPPVDGIRGGVDVQARSAAH